MIDGSKCGQVRTTHIAKCSCNTQGVHEVLRRGIRGRGLHPCEQGGEKSLHNYRDEKTSRVSVNGALMIQSMCILLELFGVVSSEGEEE